MKRTKKTDAQKKTKNGIKINMIDQICISTKKVKIKKVKGYKKALEVRYAKVSGASRYQIQVATDKKFKKNKKTVTVKKSKTKVKINKLKKKKKYYVRVRAYKSVSGKKVYGAWSKVRTVKTK